MSAADVNTAADPAEVYDCTCGASNAAHCQDCWACPGWHDELCGW